MVLKLFYRLLVLFQLFLTQRQTQEEISPIDEPNWKKSVSLDKSFPPSTIKVTEKNLMLNSSIPYQTWKKTFHAA